MNFIYIPCLPTFLITNVYFTALTFCMPLVSTDKRSIQGPAKGSEYNFYSQAWNSSSNVVHGGCGHGQQDPDSEGERILEYTLAYDLLVGNRCFKKHNSRLMVLKLCILFKGACASLLLVCRCTIPGEEVALQHQLLVYDMTDDICHPKSSTSSPPSKSLKAQKSSSVLPIPESLQGPCACCGN